ncbi:GNAT family N-acetyltransferase [Brevibacillus laterosporus]|uniref:GNAT family N-acetyltransferase n=1 Tax=Brevibacillus laterosporus TaxID=1465 RepID=UPI000CE2CA08|nr:GNAT family N-acetyltransferase [Brevibacillus laterosporus]MED1665281.1 GNAT family N-acetyltransferase [Brevibacillus laterosporus]MED1668589.1 GNAT family N-acetyltransferase [Brevibacillus laterosporus]MED1719248.1 GNAT family N-acetyltransferase [Brevibacillus laterosporus]PPA86275.1 GNAT family N-acetyltransferase [Brevibacillus laterosporus]
MIRKLTEADREAFIDLVAKERSLNLFLIGDVENFGFSTHFQELWGEWSADDQTKLSAVLLRYYHAYVFYAPASFDLKGFSEILLADKKLEVLSGKQDCLQAFASYLPKHVIKTTYFAELVDDSQLPKDEINKFEVKKATVHDVKKIVNLRNQIEEFGTSADAEEALRHTLESSTGRTYYVEMNTETVACASTTAECSMAAMIVGVCTHTNYRKRGYASACMVALCRDVLAEGRNLCLFYDNPVAGAIYKRLGFQDIGMWTMYQIKREESF